MTLYKARDRRQTQAITVLIAFLVASLIGNAASSWGLFEALDKLETVSQDTNELVTAQNRSQTPEARQAQQRLLDDIVTKIGCEQREGMQDLVDQLVKVGILPPGSVAVVVDACRPPAP